MALSSLHRSLRPFPVFRLALADLRDEWLLSFCICLATAAVLAPLLILFGLKSGAIDILRNRLIEDPRNREVRPKITRTYPEVWFSEIRKRPDVSFVIPLTRGVSSTVQAVNTSSGSEVQLDLSPTGAGDAIVLENGGRIPRDNECVLSSSAAGALSTKVGDKIQIRTSRRVDGQFQTAQLDLRVAGILHLRAGGADVAYVPLKVLEAVEQYLDGGAVLEYGWPGKKPLAYPEHDGALLLGPATDMDSTLERRLVTDTGFAYLSTVKPDDMVKVAGFLPAEGQTYWLLRPAGASVRTENFEALADRLRGTQIRAIPWIDNLPVTLKTADGRQFKRMLKVSPEVVAEVAERAGKFNARAADPDLPPGTECQLAPGAASGELLVTAVTSGQSAVPGVLLVPPREAGLLRLAATRRLLADKETGQLLLTRRGYAGFRMYAKSIDQVDRLRAYLESQEIPVFHEAERINDVVMLDRQLTRFFWFIAAIGIAGAIATLAASLYASAERKSYELSVLRLLGFTRFEIVQFPAWQALVLTALGFALSLAVYAAAAATLQGVFSDQLNVGERLMFLPSTPVTLIFATIAALAVLSSFLASHRILGSDLSESLREGTG
jgi:putative ABC transport system permease protein